MIHINHLFAGEDAAQFSDLKRLDAVKLDANAVMAVLLQNRFPFGKVVAGKPIDQHLEIVCHRKFSVWKQSGHAETGIRWQDA